MKANAARVLSAGLVIDMTAPITWHASADGELVSFPENDAAGVLHASVDRGNIREEIFTSRTAIDAVKNGQPTPSGTVITLMDYQASSDSAAM